MPALIAYLMQSSQDALDPLDVRPEPDALTMVFGCGLFIIPFLVAGLLGYFIGKSKGRAQGRKELLEELQTKRDFNPPPEQ